VDHGNGDSSDEASGKGKRAPKRKITGNVAHIKQEPALETAGGVCIKQEDDSDLGGGTHIKKAGSVRPFAGGKVGKGQVEADLDEADRKILDVLKNLE
jgi:hypothetical protein